MIMILRAMNPNLDHYRDQNPHWSISSINGKPNSYK